MIIAVDGPAGSGKSTIARLVANKLELEYLDTGAMYRIFTYNLIKKNISFSDLTAIKKELDNFNMDIINNEFYLDGVNVSNEIRQTNISQNVSKVATIKDVRDKMVDLQRMISKSKNIILDGRDIGTVVFPNADFKFFLVASVEERAKRRYKELIVKDENISYDDIIKNIQERDRIDSTREESPLKKAEDAYEIDTTKYTIEEVKEMIINIIKTNRN